MWKQLLIALVVVFSIATTFGLTLLVFLYVLKAAVILILVIVLNVVQATH